MKYINAMNQSTKTMSFATSLATKSLKCARNARVANPVKNGGILSMECSSLDSSMSSCMSLSPMSSVGRKTPSATPIQAQRRRLSGNAKPGKTRMTLGEIKTALEPITRAREQHGLNLPF
mmetsp:Transcript_20235/g.50344  ORF Transcript_20235/g.50344 Transcript_20235/m.50344 type:complete len:120 (+) Transcript_20235:118-477(+)